MFKLSSILNEIINTSSVYRGVPIDYGLEDIKDNTLGGYTIHNIKVKNEYYKLYGMSLTRNLNKALEFGSLIFELDKDKLKQNYKIIPINFWKTISAEKDKQSEKNDEFEEFLIFKKEKIEKTDKYQVNSYDRAGEINLDKYLNQIFLNKKYKDIENYKGESLSLIKNHPKFAGYI